MSISPPIDVRHLDQMIDCFNEIWSDAILARELYRRSGQGDIDSYYLSRARARAIVSTRDRHTLHYTVHAYPSECIIVELGCGAAQYSHVLSQFGFRTIAIELDKQRFALACALRELVNGACKLQRGDFLDCDIPKGALVVCLNIVSREVSAMHLQRVAAELDRGSDLLLSRPTFGCPDKIGQADWREFNHCIEKYHLHNIDSELICVQGRRRD